MFRHLLLPLTGTGLDAEAVRHARAMALLAGADVHVMRVLEPPERGLDAGPIDTLEWHARRVAAEEGLARVADELRARFAAPASPGPVGEPSPLPKPVTPAGDPSLDGPIEAPKRD